ncbi:MAG: hypothetical protein NTX45_11830 [Proteobacteria bacterium]|nr:hypothetical protein [Pseudomonadota bacterium]
MNTQHKSHSLLFSLMLLSACFASDCLAVNEMLNLSVVPAQPGGTAHATIQLLNTEDMESFSLQLSFASGGMLSLPATNWFARGNYFPASPFGPVLPQVDLNNYDDSASRTKIFLDGFNPSGVSGAVGVVSLSVAGNVGNTQILTLSGEYWSKADQQVKTLSSVNAEVRAVSSNDQTIIFGNPPTVVVGGTGNVSATGGLSGNPVIITSQTTGVCTINGNTVSGLTVGTCTLQANQTGNASYNDAPTTTESFTVNKANQTIIFGAVPTLAVGGTGTVSATGGVSGNPVIFNSQTLDVCSVVGNTVKGIKAGACTIAANQLGNASYNAAQQVTQGINVLGSFALNIVNMGDGLISSTPTGINCGTLGGLACQFNFTVNTSVTLVAKSSVNSVFTGWGGACSGTISSCTFTLNADKTVTANFAKWRRSAWKRALMFNEIP